MSAETAREFFFLSGSRGPWRWLGGATLVGDGGDRLAAEAGGGSAICWTGTVGGGLFEEDPATWMGAGREALGREVERAAGALRGGRLLLRPHHRHALSDVPACRWLVERWGEAGIGLALDAASMVSAGMEDRWEQAVERAFGALGAQSGVVVLCNARWRLDGSAEACGLMEGALDGATLLRLALETTGRGVPFALVEGDEAGRVAVAGACGGG